MDLAENMEIGQRLKPEDKNEKDGMMSGHSKTSDVFSQFSPIEERSRAYSRPVSNS